MRTITKRSLHNIFWANYLIVFVKIGAISINSLKTFTKHALKHLDNPNYCHFLLIKVKSNKLTPLSQIMNFRGSIGDLALFSKASSAKSDPENSI